MQELLKVPFPTVLALVFPAAVLLLLFRLAKQELAGVTEQVQALLRALVLASTEQARGCSGPTVVLVEDQAQLLVQAQLLALLLQSAWLL